MMCLLLIKELDSNDRFLSDYDPSSNIRGWLIATDIHDMRRKTGVIDDNKIAQWLYQHEFLNPGIYKLPNHHILLVQ